MHGGNYKPVVVLADDHFGILNKVAQVLAEEAKIVASVSDGSAAVQAAMEFRPDVLVLDIAMPNLTGIEAAREIRRRGLSPRIIFLTIQQDPEMIDAACEIGASYVLKKKMHIDLILALKEELVGRRFVSTPDVPAVRSGCEGNY